MDDPYWLQFERGQYLIFKVDGSDYLVDAKPTFAAIRNSIRADHIDTVILTWSSGDVPDLVMVFDNTGMIDNPLNEKRQRSRTQTSTAMRRSFTTPIWLE